MNMEEDKSIASALDLVSTFLNEMINLPSVTNAAPELKNKLKHLSFIVSFAATDLFDSVHQFHQDLLTDIASDKLTWESEDQLDASHWSFKGRSAKL